MFARLHLLGPTVSSSAERADVGVSGKPAIAKMLRGCGMAEARAG
jgi:hypothetical protein